MRILSPSLTMAHYEPSSDLFSLKPIFKFQNSASNMQLTTIWVILAAAATVMAAPIVRDNRYSAHNLMNPHNHGRLSWSIPSGIESTFVGTVVNKRANTPRPPTPPRRATSPPPRRGSTPPPPAPPRRASTPPPAAPVQHAPVIQAPRPVRPAPNVVQHLEAQVGGQRPRPPTPNRTPPLVHGGPSPPDTAGPRTPQNPQGHH